MTDFSTVLLPTRGDKYSVLSEDEVSSVQDYIDIETGDFLTEVGVTALASALPRDRRLINYLDRQGFVYPARLVRAARRVDLGISRALAMTTMETGNGKNVYGHDPVSTGGCYSYGGTVTKSNYACYKRHRGTTRMQGVGPTQLTWWAFQDRADRLGGCHHPYYNNVVGFAIFREYRRSGDSVWEAAKRYNGASAYADRFVQWDREWQHRLKRAGF